MNQATFRSLHAGDIIEGQGAARDFGRVTVVAIQQSLDWEAWHAAIRKGKDAKPWEFEYTWAVETKPYQYVKENDWVVAYLHLVQRGAEEK